MLWIEVPQADYRYKPVYINENPMKGSYKRNHEGDYHCTGEEVKAMLRDASDYGMDGGILDGFTMDDIDLNTLRSYRIEYERHNPDHVWNGKDDKEFLRNLGAYALDRSTKREGLTTAGLLMFGKGLAIRERFDNIRMDYHSTGILKVIKYDDGFLFSNPGNLKLPVHAIYEGGHSVARNPKIQKMFRMIGLGDNIGSGFPTILKAWGDEKWRQPDLYDDQELHQVELRLWMVSLMPTECTEYLNNKFGTAYCHLHSEEQIILATAYLEEKVSNARLQSVLGLHSTEIGKLLFNLVEKNMLIAERRGRWTTYHINREYVIQPEQLELTDISIPELDLNRTDQLIYQFVQVNKIITTQQIVDIIDSISTKQGASVAINRLINKGLLIKVRQGRHVFYTLK